MGIKYNFFITGLVKAREKGFSKLKINSIDTISQDLVIRNDDEDNINRSLQTNIVIQNNIQKTNEQEPFSQQK